MRLLASAALLLALAGSGCLTDGCPLVTSWTQPGLFDELPPASRTKLPVGLAFDPATAGLVGNERLLVLTDLEWRSPQSDARVSLASHGAWLTIPQDAPDDLAREALEAFLGSAGVPDLVAQRGGVEPILASRELFGNPTPTRARFTLPLTVEDLDATALFAASGATVGWSAAGPGASTPEWIFFMAGPQATATYPTPEGDVVIATRIDGWSVATFGGYPDFEDAPSARAATRLLHEAFAKAAHGPPPDDLRWHHQCGG